MDANRTTRNIQKYLKLSETFSNDHGNQQLTEARSTLTKKPAKQRERAVIRGSWFDWFD
jgi:hypothetical protein